MRIECERALEKLDGRRVLPAGARNHSGMVKEARVARSESQRVLHRPLRFDDVAGFKRRPRERVRAVDIVPPGRVLALRERVGFFGLQVVVGIEQR